MRKTIVYAGTLVLCLLILSGCGKLDRKGTPAENSPPKVYFSNIPPESTYFSVNPRIYWYGTDADGFVAAYQYAVVVTDSVPNYGGLEELRSILHDIPSDSTSWVDQTTLRDVLGVHVQSEPGGHQRNVVMFAEMDPEIYTPQYLFLRAVDNEGAVSEDVIYRLYYRNNHRPEAFVDVDDEFAQETHYCLEETTLTWDGISISWSGLDTADYPDRRDQPEFKFRWQLVGPFGEEPTPETVDTTKIFYFSLDSVFVAGEWKKSQWVSENTHVFVNLDNYPGSGFGWYQLRLWAQDDAFVSNDLATTLNFRIIKPPFRYADKDRNTILVVDHTAYGGVDGGPPLDTAVGLVRPFYDDALAALPADLCDEYLVWYDPVTKPEVVTKNAPGKDLISQYDLVIVINVGSKSAISGDNRDDYEEYMDIGGRLWLVGMNNYSIDTGDEPTELSDFWLEYFGIEQARAPTWTVLDSTSLEFIKAKPFGEEWEDLQTLEADQELCAKLKGYNPNEAVRKFGERGIPFVCYQGLSNLVDYESRIPAERRMFTFISYYGTLSTMDGRPCGLNWIGPTFRTAEFTFPLNLMRNDAPDYPAFKVVERTVSWFMKDLP
jgi:hypothetical protein